MGYSVLSASWEMQCSVHHGISVLNATWEFMLFMHSVMIQQNNIMVTDFLETHT